MGMPRACRARVRNAVEIGEIDRDEDVRTDGLGGADQGAVGRPGPRDDAERFGQAGHRQTPEIADQRCPGRLQPLPAEPGNHRVGLQPGISDASAPAYRSPGARRTRSSRAESLSASRRRGTATARSPGSADTVAHLGGLLPGLERRRPGEERGSSGTLDWYRSACAARSRSPGRGHRGVCDLDARHVAIVRELSSARCRPLLAFEP